MEVIYYLYRALDMLVAPFMDPELLWIVLPTIFILLMITLYFGRHATEEIGWNTAFANSISLMWICIILSRMLLNTYTLDQILSNPLIRNKLIVLILLVGWVIILQLVNYFHAVPKKLAFFLSNSIPIYTMAYVVTSLLINFEITRFNLMSAGILWVIMIVASEIIMLFIPITSTAKHAKAGKKAYRTRRWNEIKNKIKKIKKKLINNLKRKKE